MTSFNMVTSISMFSCQQLLLMLFLLPAVFWQFVMSDVLPSCQPQDFHFEYTECDSQGGRWRVSVPKPGICTGGAPNAPVRGKGCDFTCQAGQYLNIQEDQECHPCPAGHFSLGGGVRFDDFEGPLPTGFSQEMEGFSSLLAPEFIAKMLGYRNTGNCSGAGWYAKENYLMTDVLDCTAVLTYTANLVKPGTVTFTYQNEDDAVFFNFEVQNSQCQTSSGDKGFLDMTQPGEPKSMEYRLKTGPNVLIWRAFKPSSSLSSQSSAGQKQNRVLIHSIDISGVAYTSECTPCKPGTYSREGQSQCSDCPANTYSKRGSSSCIECHAETEYSDVGSDTCVTRVACTVNDYYQYNSPCDARNKTQKLYKWIEPQLCRLNLADSVSLPEPGPLEACPPCNPGMEFSNGTCRFCPANHFSSGAAPCAICPGSTAPQTGIVYQWWNELTKEYNLTSRCLSSIEGRRCTSQQVWMPAGDNIGTVRGQADDSYFMLSLRIGGFKGREEVLHGRLMPIAQLSFLFELNCVSDCSLTFMQGSGSKDINLIESWTGETPKTRFETDISRTGPVTFTWAFQRSSQSGTTYSDTSMAKIYLINVTNTLMGGANECKTCPKGASQNGCIPCPDGHYVDLNTTMCMPCPPGTVAHGLNPWGVESCVSCGLGLTPREDKTRCITSCQYTSSSGAHYDYTPLATIQTLEGSRLFTTSGYKYYNEFKLSLCGGNGVYPLATCFTNTSSKFSPQEGIPAGIESPVCRVTVLPASPGEKSGAVYTQQISLGDMLVAVTDSVDVYNITEHKQEAGFLPTDGSTPNDVHFIYVSDSVTSACRQGLTTIVTLRCDLTIGDTSVLTLPSRCVTGTCDGCTYTLLWRSRYACPLCAMEKNFTEYLQPCENGKQKVMKTYQRECYMEAALKNATQREQKCSIWWQDHWPIWLKAIVISVPVVLISGCILLIVVCHCWIKNKSSEHGARSNSQNSSRRYQTRDYGKAHLHLQYKYMKLIEASNKEGSGELPAAETCALDEGEDDEQFDAVHFKSKGRKIFGKLTHIGRRQDKVDASEMSKLNESSRLKEFK